MGMRSVLLYSISTAVLLLAFQNCAGPIEGASDEKAARIARLNQDAPFAYDVTVNRLAYMSCVDGPKNSERQLLDTANGFFTFKAVAADEINGGGNAGIRLSDAFTDFMDKNLSKRTNDKGELSLRRSDVKELLLGSAKNRSAQIQLAVRPVEKPAIRLQEPAELGQGVANILPELTSDLVADQIVDLKPGERLNFIDGGKGIDGRDFEGAIGFFSGEADQEQIRTDIANKRNSMIMMTFRAPASTDQTTGSPDGSEFRARSPFELDGASSEDTAYGTGFQPFFTQADSRYADAPNHVMREIREYDLAVAPEDRSNKAEWICDPALRYMIFSPEDAEDSALPVNCPKIEDPVTSSNPAILLELQMLRSVLPDEHWHINIPGKCIIPKRGDCYPKDIPVQYETSQECGPGKTKDCAHFLSICYRATK